MAVHGVLLGAVIAGDGLWKTCCEVAMWTQMQTPTNMDMTEAGFIARKGGNGGG